MSLHDAMETVNVSLSKIPDTTQLVSNLYWSSLEFGAEKAWVVNIREGTDNVVGKKYVTYNYYARPVRTIYY